MENNNLTKELENKLKELISKSYKNLKPELEKDVKAFLQASAEKLERWATLYTTESINEEELEWLLKSQLDLVSLQALQTAGISKIKLNTLKNNIIKLIFNFIIGLIKSQS
ncbi:hypothetical protein ACFFLS_10115 [Flavobacterium procerum]|uniref:Uncharacterized protein n=1 Tax=Flavobacterium procerum TaxID=1455569 RepID=A0ABV6BPM5_9FLAO